jgi:hypothetical protein
MTTKDELLKSHPRQPITRRTAQPAARPAQRVGPRNTAKLNFESLCKLRDKLNVRVLDNRATPAEMSLIQALNALPRTMPKATKTPGTTEAAYNLVWDGFTNRINAALPQIQKLRNQAGLRS